MGGTHSYKKSVVDQWPELGKFEQLKNSKGKDPAKWNLSNKSWRSTKTYYLSTSENKIVYGRKRNAWDTATANDNVLDARKMELQDIEAMCYIPGGVRNSEAQRELLSKDIQNNRYCRYEERDDDYAETIERLESAVDALTKHGIVNVLLIMRKERNHVLRVPGDIKTDKATVIDEKTVQPYEAPCQEEKNSETNMKNFIRDVKAAIIAENADIAAAAEKATLQTRRRLNAGVAELGTCTSPASYALEQPSNQLELCSLPVVMVLLALLFFFGWVLKRRFNLFQQKERVRRDTFGFLPNSSRPSLNAAERMV